MPAQRGADVADHRLAPDFKTIADFRRDNGQGIRNVCRRFVLLCRELKLFTQVVVAIDSSKFKAVNNRERNYTPGKIEGRERELEESIQRYLDALDTADRTQPAELESKTERLQGKIQKMRQRLKAPLLRPIAPTQSSERAVGTEETSRRGPRQPALGSAPTWASATWLDRAPSYHTASAHS